MPQEAVSELPYKIPTSVGVVLPLGISTAAAGLYQKDYLALPFPSEKPETLDRTVLIWGGSSSVGSCCIQLAVASGLDVITTASPRNSEYCKKLGAKQVFDYHNDAVEDEIIKALKDKTVVGAYHATGGASAFLSCASIMDQTKGKAIVVTVEGVPEKGVPSSVRTKMSKWSLNSYRIVPNANYAVQYHLRTSSATKSAHTSGASSCRRHWRRARLYLHRTRLWSERS